MALFQRGDRVEISTKEEGLLGSYYLANIIAWISDQDYIIQYKTLLNDDGLAPLREVVSADQIRPLPEEIPVKRFRVSDVVDACDNDGWWIGKICMKIGSDYLVKFENTGEESVYSFDLIRIHQDWVDGVWVSSKKYGTL